MTQVVQNFKNELARAFSDKNARRDNEGNAAFNEFSDVQTEENIEDEKIENTECSDSSSSGGFESPMTTKQETKESTGSDSSGSYVTPKAWAKSSSKKDWRGRAKTQIPGGKFVTIKQRCKTFPYCNQGDIKALKLYENKDVKTLIEKISKEHNVSENVIKAIIQYEIEKSKNK